MYNLPKFDFENAAKNLNITYKTQCCHLACTLPKITEAGNGRNGRKQQTSLYIIAAQLQPFFSHRVSRASVASCMNAIGRDVDRYLCHLKNGFINTFCYDM